MEGPELLGGRYELRDVLGFGGMAEVRDGWDTRLNRAVAVKLLHPGLASEPAIRERFRVEARAAAALNHSNIVAVYDYGEQGATSYIVMERLGGDTLGDQVARGPLPQAQVYAALESVLSALSAAHDAGMLHRDIKPSNILLASDTVKVADFGIAKTPGARNTTTGELVGTLAYLSPERLAGEPASIADDLYAAAVVGYEALTGRKPFPEEDVAPLARAIIEKQAPPLARLRPDVEPSLALVIERAMSRDLSHRFPNADAMRAQLTSGGGRMAASTVPVISPSRPSTRMLSTPLASSGAFAVPSSTRRWARGPARKALGAAAVLAAIAVATLAFAFDSSTTPPRKSEPVSVSTAGPAPVTAAAPVVQPAPSSPVIEPATIQETPGNGNGNGNGNGKKKGPKH
jgi:serine/threonine protein kinase